jgi:uncharacterized membrane protein YqjE
MKILALVLVGLSVAALTVLVMAAPTQHQNRISVCLVIVVLAFLIDCYTLGQGAR